jgi:hypothetical protein
MKNKILSQFLSIGLFILIIAPLNAQTITKKPIYEGVQSLSIIESGQRIGFLYQDSDYTTIVAIESFYLNSKSDAIKLIEKAIAMLKMEKTDKDQNIEDYFNGLRLVRYGFMQKKICIFNEDRKDLTLNLKTLEKIKIAIEEYK